MPCCWIKKDSALRTYTFLTTDGGLMFLIKKLFAETLWLIPIALCWWCAYIIYISSLLLNHRMREAGMELPGITHLLLQSSQFRLPFIVAGIFTAGYFLLPLKPVASKSFYLGFSLLIFVIYSTSALFCASIPYACLCDAWTKW